MARRTLSRNALVFVIALVAAATPIIAGAYARIDEGWRPTSDEGMIARLSDDVFTHKTPLVGMPSTISVDDPTADPHHLGPLEFWALAVPARVAHGSPIGFVVAVAVLNLAWVAGIGWFAYRRRGFLWAATALVLLAFMFAALGRDVLTSMWNPYFAIAPLAFLFVGAWSVASGDSLAVPFGLAAASLVVQEHIVFAPIVVGLVLAGAAGLVFAVRAGTAAPGTRRHLIVGAVVLLVSWALPVVQQITHRPGNFVELWAGASGRGTQPFGVSYSARFVARAVSIPPFWIRRQADAFRYIATGDALRVYELIGAVAFVVALVALTAWSWRRQPVVRNALLIAAVGLVVSLLTVARLPLQFRAPSPYRTSMVRVAGWFAWFAVLLGAHSALTAWWGERARPRPARAAAMVGATALLVCAITTGVRRSSSYLRNPDDGPAIAALSAQTRAKVGRGPYRLDEQGAPAFYSPAPGLMWDLVRHGIDIRVDPRDRYIGNVHGAHPGLPDLVLQFGADPASPDPSMVEVARYRGVSAADMRKVRRLRAAALRLLRRDGRPEVLPVGLRYRTEQPDSQPGRAVSEYTSHDQTLEQLVDGDTLRALVFDHLVDTDAAYVKPLTEYKDMEDAIRQEDFTLYATRSALGGR